jgi:protein gp37
MADVFEARKDLNPSREKLWSLINETPQLDWLLLTKRPERILQCVPWKDEWPTNVWVGTTVEDQESADKRLPYLAKVPAAVRFISAEPLLSELKLESWLSSSINWVITGGESGPHARPSSPSWFRSLLTQCMQAEVPFHFKQWGDWAPGQGINFPIARKTAREAQDGTLMLRLGKKTAGRLLDGETWDGLPKIKAA